MFKLLVPYYSHAPPKFEDLKRRIEALLKPKFGTVLVTEGKHYSQTITSWVMPIELTTEGSPMLGAIEDALSSLHVVVADEV